jgi:CBS domain-containing protein
MPSGLGTALANPLHIHQESAMTTIAEIMTRDVQVIRPEDSVQHAAQCMKDLDIGAVPVCDGRKLLGMITDRDITVRASAAGLAPDRVTVREVMTSDLHWCTEEQSTAEVLEHMGAHHIRRLPVINAQKELIGIVSLGDLAIRQEAPVDAALRGVSTPGR